jgi:hypothetical protein
MDESFEAYMAYLDRFIFNNDDAKKLTAAILTLSASVGVVGIMMRRIHDEADLDEEIL